MTDLEYQEFCQFCREQENKFGSPYKTSGVPALVALNKIFKGVNND